MTYVTEQTSEELRAHMRRLQAMPGWHNPLVDRLWKEVQTLESERDQLLAEVERLRKPLTDEQIQSIADEGHRNAAGGIYAASILPFAREIERQRGAQHVDT